jgi:acetoin utilization protein AcuB
MAIVSEAMNRSPVTVAIDAPLAEAAALARESGAEHLLVMDEENLVGILCTCDLSAGREDERVWERMSLPVLTVRPDASLEDAAAAMSDCEVGCLPVALGGLVLGTLSGDELARAGVPARAHHAPHRH